MNNSRIPDYLDNSFDEMLMWFAEMSVRELLFHPEDDPQDIIRIDNGEALFTDTECQHLRTIMNSMFERFGDGVCDAAYPVFMKAMGLRLDA
ncbi:MAG: hypothetical protein ACRESZ_10060 [Methylococcales bacterium]